MELVYGLIGLILDNLELFVLLMFAAVVFAIWFVIRRRAAWIAVAHTTVCLVLAFSVFVVGARCKEASEGSGERIGSKSIAVRSGHDGIAVRLQSAPIDPDEAPSSRFLNAQGVTSLRTVDGGQSWAALTRASFQIPVPGPKPRAGFWVVVSGAVSLLPWFMALSAVERILRRSRRGEPFSSRNVRDLRWLAFALSGAVYIAIAVDYLVASWAGNDVGVGIMLQPGYDQTLEVHLTIPFVPLAAGALILALAEVWRYGINLQRDVEATV